MYNISGELVVGTLPLINVELAKLLSLDGSDAGTQTKDITKPVSEDQDEGYGTQKIATAVHSGLLESCEPNPNPDEEESQAVNDRPINVTDELQEDKIETETAKSPQKLHTLHSCPSAPGTSRYTSHNELACPVIEPARMPAIEPARMPPSNSPTEHQLKLLDTGQPPGENNSTSEDMWCSECSPSESPHPSVGALVISSSSVITPPHDSEAPFGGIVPPYYFWDSEACVQENNCKISDVKPFYSLAGPEFTEDGQGLMSALMGWH